MSSSADRHIARCDRVTEFEIAYCSQRAQVLPTLVASTTMQLDPTVKLGDLLTALSVTIAAATLAWSWWQDRALREREYADRIRRGAIRALVALERWKEIGLRFFDADIQPLLSETDLELITKQDVRAARDFLWRALMHARRDATKVIVAEHLEGAYQDLYLHDPTIHQMYVTAVDLLKAHQKQFFGTLLDVTQTIVLAADRDPRPFTSAHVGNPLRDVVAEIASGFAEAADRAILPFRNRVLQLLELSDADIRARHSDRQQRAGS